MFSNGGHLKLRANDKSEVMYRDILHFVFAVSELALPLSRCYSDRYVFLPEHILTPFRFALFIRSLCCRGECNRDAIYCVSTTGGAAAGFNRVGETGLFPVSPTHTTRHTVRYRGGSLLTIQLYDNNP
jgi:hypothetical protein